MNRTKSPPPSQWDTQAFLYKPKQYPGAEPQYFDALHVKIIICPIPLIHGKYRKQPATAPDGHGAHDAVHPPILISSLQNLSPRFSGGISGFRITNCPMPSNGIPSRSAASFFKSSDFHKDFYSCSQVALHPKIRIGAFQISHIMPFPYRDRRPAFLCK